MCAAVMVEPAAFAAATTLDLRDLPLRAQKSLKITNQTFHFSTLLILSHLSLSEKLCKIRCNLINLIFVIIIRVRLRCSSFYLGLFAVVITGHYYVIN